MKKMNKKGFTIVELVIVIAVIAILAAVMIPTFSGVVEKANQSKALQEVRNAYTATLADDLSKTGENPTYIVYKATANIVVDYDGFVISIDKDTGAASVLVDTATNTPAAAATHTLNNNKLVKN